MRRRRKFTAQFKSQVVLQLLTGERSMVEVCREHQLSAQMIGSWKQQFLAAAPQAFEKGGESGGEQERIAELERMVGKLTMELEIAKKATSIAHSLAQTGGSHATANRSLSRGEDL
jgi:transposase-like protein